MGIRVGEKRSLIRGTWMTLLFLHRHGGIYGQAVERLHEFFDLGGFEANPNKTQLEGVEHGFDWLGILYTPKGPG